MREPRSALKDAAAADPLGPRANRRPTRQQLCAPDPCAVSQSPHPTLDAKACLRVTRRLCPRQLRTASAGVTQERTVFLVRRSVCSDRTQLESIERDWNAQTLARSRRRLSGDEARQSVWGELRGFGAVVVERSIAIVAAILLLCADHVRATAPSARDPGPANGN